MLLHFSKFALPALVLSLSFNAFASESASTSPETKREARGVLKAKQSAKLAAGMSAKILRVPYKAGQKFRRGALLIKFDCERLQAEKTTLQAIKTGASLKHENVRELLLAGAAGELEETLAAADVKRAVAELGVANVKLKGCEIHAPYSGIIQEKHISAYDTPALNAPLLSILRTGTPEIKLIAPSAWLAWLKPGAEFNFTIDETGKTYAAKFIRTGASVDPVSQTIELTAKFKKSAPGALSGMSGVASFTIADTQ